MKPMAILGLLLGLLSLLTLSGASVPTLTVVGEGRALVPADTVFVTFGVTAEDENVTVASLESAEALNRTIEALIEAGVERDDVQSGRGRSVQRIQTMSRVCNNSTCMTVTGSAVGRVTEQVTIRFDAEEGALIARCIDISGAEGAEAVISGYRLEDESEAIAEARQMAVEDAEENAEDLASAAGLVLGGRLEIFEPSYPRAYQQPGGLDPFGLGMMELFDLFMPTFDTSETGPSLEPGMVEVRSQVVVTYELTT
ncbi:SIMPL domain-containing protein [Methanocrinis sp.]|uniref:SIMPL domain-containing protein n=1 Tax=Methanocrinis sp. TaxID=3101522 RepID=UPI003D0A7FDB